MSAGHEIPLDFHDIGKEKGKDEIWNQRVLTSDPRTILHN